MSLEWRANCGEMLTVRFVATCQDFVGASQPLQPPQELA